jgi:hypothetical protein
VVGLAGGFVGSSLFVGTILYVNCTRAEIVAFLREKRSPLG